MTTHAASFRDGTHPPGDCSVCTDDAIELPEVTDWPREHAQHLTTKVRCASWCPLCNPALLIPGRMR